MLVEQTLKHKTPTNMTVNVLLATVSHANVSVTHPHDIQLENIIVTSIYKNLGNIGELRE